MNNGAPMVPLGEVLRLSIDSVDVDPSASYPIAGVYSFGRGMLARPPLLGTQTTYKVLHRLHENDYVLSQLKAWEGALARVPKSFDNWFLSPQFPTFRTVPSRLEVSYLDWYCKQSKVWEELRNQARGMGARRDSVSPNRFLAVKIPLPPLSEQQRIVARIDELAAKIEEARGLRQQAVEEGDAILPAILGQFFKALANNIKVKSLNDLSLCITDGPHKTPYYVQRGIPFVTVKNMVTGKLNLDDVQYITTSDHEEFSKRCKPEQGDVLYSKDGATRGQPCFVDSDREFNIFVSVALIKPLREQLNGRYLCHLLNSTWIKDRMVNKSRGDMIPHIVLREIRQYPVPVPPLDEQIRIVDYLDDLQGKVDSLRCFQAETAADVDALLPSILDKAFKGDL